MKTIGILFVILFKYLIESTYKKFKIVEKEEMNDFYKKELVRLRERNQEYYDNLLIAKKL